MTDNLPAGLRSRPMTPVDTSAVVALLTESELRVHGVSEVDAEDIESNVSRLGWDPVSDSLVVLDGEHVVGWADFYRGKAEVGVHPDWAGRGIGSALASWAERRAAAHGERSVRQTVTDANLAARDLLERAGYQAAYTAWILEADFTEQPPAPPVLPAGVTVRAYGGPADEPSVYALIERAFSEWPGRDPSTLDQWRAYVAQHTAFAPALSALAYDGDDLVGAALSYDYAGSDEGWVQQLAVAAPYRGQGIARALLQTVFRAFAEQGKVKCGLSTDSRTGALSLYEHVGMRVRRSFTGWAKTLP